MCVFCGVCFFFISFHLILFLKIQNNLFNRENIFFLNKQWINYFV